MVLLILGQSQLDGEIHWKSQHLDSNVRKQKKQVCVNDEWNWLDAQLIQTHQVAV